MSVDGDSYCNGCWPPDALRHVLGSFWVIGKASMWLGGYGGCQDVVGDIGNKQKNVLSLSNVM